MNKLPINQIIHADALNMPLQDCSVDAIVTDPPYGLEFMGKEWDKFGISEARARYLRGERHSNKFGNIDKPDSIDGRRLENKGRYLEMKKEEKASFQRWSIQWLTEAYRVLKPGGSMLVMGGTRTFHRLMCAIEDSGFIIKDTLMWIYGSGFPKAQDLGKMIDKRNGRHPDNVKFRKYLKSQRDKSGHTMEEINKTIGTSTMAGHWFGETQCTLPSVKQYKILKDILNLDNRFDELIEREEAEREKIGKHKSGLGSGITYAFTDDNIKANKEIDDTIPSTDLAKYWDGFKIGGIKPAYEPIVWAVKPPEGSYVDNVLKWGVGAVNVDECRIGTERLNYTSNMERLQKWSKEQGYRKYKDGTKSGDLPQQVKGRFPANIILDEESAKVMDEQSGASKSSGGLTKTFAKNHRVYGEPGIDKLRENAGGLGDSGGASRFFYCAKASRSERNAGLDNLQGENQRYQDGRGNSHECFEMEGCGRKTGTVNKNNHPTVKPIALFEWLIKLVTRKGQTVLDPFLGSGTTAVSAHNTGRKCIGIEKEGEYIEIAKRRIIYWESQGRQGVL